MMKNEGTLAWLLGLVEKRGARVTRPRLSRQGRGGAAYRSPGRRRARLLAIVGLLACLVIGWREAAGASVWKNTSTNFNKKQSWSPKTSPSSTVGAEFGNTTVNNNPQVTGNISVNGITFDAGTAGWTFSSSGNYALSLYSGITNNSSNTQTFTNGSGALTLNTGNASVTFGGNGTGNLVFSNSAITLGGQSLTLAGNGAAASSISSVISGSGNITVNGNTTWALSGNNTYSGGTNINSGTLQFSVAGNLGSGALAFNGGTLQATNTSAVSLSGTVILNSGGGTVQTGSGNLTLSGAISGAGALTYNGASGGALILSGSNTYSGGTNINSGTLQASSDSNLGASGGSISVNGGTLEAAGNLSGGARSLSVGSSGGTIQLDGSNAVSLNSITSASGSTLGIAATGGNGTVSLASGSTISGSLNLVGNATIAFNGGANVIGGTLTAASGGSITVSGSGTTLVTSQSLTSAFAGKIVVNAGAVYTVSGTDSSATIVLNGGTLAISGAVTLSSLYIIGAGSVVDFQGSASNTLTLGNQLDTSAAGASLSVVNTGYATPTLTDFYVPTWVGGPSAWNSSYSPYSPPPGTTSSNVSYPGFSSYPVGWYNHYVTPVPEPRAYGFLLLGLSTALVVMVRRKNSEAPRPAEMAGGRAGAR